MTTPVGRDVVHTGTYRLTTAVVRCCACRGPYRRIVPKYEERVCVQEIPLLAILHRNPWRSIGGVDSKTESIYTCGSRNYHSTPTYPVKSGDTIISSHGIHRIQRICFDHSPTSTSLWRDACGVFAYEVRRRRFHSAEQGNTALFSTVLHYLVIEMKV